MLPIQLNFTPEQLFKLSLDKPSTQESTSSGSYFVNFCNYFYYLGAMPFRFKSKGSSFEYELIMRKKQKVFCVLLYALTVLPEIKEVRRILTKKPDKIIYFEFGNLLAMWFLLGSLFITLWFRSNAFLQLINQFQYYANQDGRIVKHRKANYLTGVVIIGTLSAYLFLTVARDFNSQEWVLDAVATKWAGKALSYFFLESQQENLMSSWMAQVGLAIFYLTVKISTIIITRLPETLMLISGLCWIETVRNFKKKLESDEFFITTQDVFVEWGRLKNLSEFMNRALGVCTFGYVLGDLPYIVYTFVEFVQPGSSFIFFRRFLMFGNYFGFLIMASIANKNCSALEDWLKMDRNYLKIPEPHLSILLHDITQDDVGFHAIKFVKISSKLLGAIFSLMLTFAAIVIQLKLL